MTQTKRGSIVPAGQAVEARIGALDRLEYFLRSRASKVVVLALVANTMVAQLLYNSAGQLVLGNGVLLAYLIISAACSTLAFALFEVATIFQLHDLMSLDASIKAEIGAEKLIKRGYIVLAVSSLINFLSVLYFLGLAWHTVSGHSSKFPLDDLPQPWNWAITHSTRWRTPRYCSWRASSASGLSPAKRLYSPPSAHLNSRRLKRGNCRNRLILLRCCDGASRWPLLQLRWPHQRRPSALRCWRRQRKGA